MLTLREQELLVMMFVKPVTFKTQNLYKNRVSFYKAVWKLRDLELVSNRELQMNGARIKEWNLRADGMLIAKILLKGKK